MSRGTSSRRCGRRLAGGAVALAALLVVLTAGSFEADAQAQLQAPADGMPPPVPPMPIPNSPGGTLTSPGVFPPPPAGAPLMLPSSPPPLAAPGLSAVPSASATRSGEAMLSAVARFGRDAPAITGGLHWRVYSDRPDQAGGFRLVREDRSAQPNLTLPPGGYVVHVAFGLASAARHVQVRGDTREVFEIPAGGLVIKGQVGDVRIPTGQIAFDIYRGSQFDQREEQRPIVANVATGETVLVPEGIYYILSKYGDGNAVVRSDIRVQAGRLTDVTVTHRAAAIMLKLVSRRGGEALANTEWVVMSPGGDIVTETKGAFPRVILAEGEYRVVARNENRTYQQDMKVIPGVDGEIEVLAR